MIKQATDHLNTISTSLQNTNTSIQQASENFQTTMAQVKVETHIGKQ